MFERKVGLSIFLILCIVVSFLAGYFVSPPKVVEKPVEKRIIRIVDSSGRYVGVPQPVKGVVALTSDSAEIIRALNASDLLLGVTKYVADGEKAFWKELAELPNVGSCFRPDYEKIIELDPDVVIAYVRWAPELEEKLEPHGIKVVRLDLYKPSMIMHETKILGLILGREKEAEELCDYWQNYLNLIESRIRDAEKAGNLTRLRVYVEGYREWSTCGIGSGWYELTMMGGGKPVGEFTIPYPKVSAEWVVDQNPDVIIKFVSSGTVPETYTAESSDLLRQVAESIKARPGLEMVNAVKNDRVYVIHAEIGSGPRYVVGVAYIAKWLYPDLFKDLKPEEIHAEYLSRFQGLEYQGFYAYPSPS